MDRICRRAGARPPARAARATTRRLLLAALAALATWLSACGPIPKTEEPAPRPLKIEEEIENVVAGHGAGLALSDTVGLDATWSRLAEIYRQRHHRPYWSNGKRPRHQAEQLLEAIRRAGEAGLDTFDYDLDHLTRLAAQAVRDSRPAQLLRARTLARFDVIATYATLRIAEHLRRGRVPRSSLDPDWRVDTLDVDRVRRILGHDPSQLFTELEPGHPGYQRLRAALARHRTIAANGGWPEIEPGPPLSLGARGPRVAALIRRLAASGDLRAPGRDSVFDKRLEGAVGSLQSRLGIPVSGVLGEATRAALNVPVERRIRQMELNLERWRWLPDSLGRRRVEINIPAYRVELIRGDRVTRAMRVVVGRRQSPTPVFSDQIVYLDLNPTWTLPPSVVTKEIVPALKRDRHYLEKNNMHVISIADARRDTVDPGQVPWKDAASDSFLYLVIQDAGPDNPLGRIKLMCPNEYDVYLHDTPMRSRFSVAVRDYSHGCVRLEHAVELADSLFRRAPDDTLVLDSLIAQGLWKRMRLPEPVPVHFLYWTAWADSAGRMSYREDIYGLDQRLDEALRSRRSHDLALNPGVGVSAFWLAAEAKAAEAAARASAARAARAARAGAKKP